MKTILAIMLAAVIGAGHGDVHFTFDKQVIRDQVERRRLLVDIYDMRGVKYYYHS
jgi:hypothetical protein